MGEILTPEFFSHLIVFIVVLLLAVSVHEAAHAWTSYKFGDDTAFMLGRVTLNPIKHTDVIGTLIIPIAAFFLGSLGGGMGRIPLIGWGKPTPVNPRKWSNYKVANFWVSIAGVLANMILVILGVVIAKIMMLQGFEPVSFFGQSTNPLAIFVGNLMFLNLSLAVFNLIPVPPLDGGKILGNFLPESFQPILEMIEQFGFIILIMLIWVGVFDLIIRPFLLALVYILYTI